MFCKYCGTEIADDSVFCAKCGKKIQEVASNNHNEKCDDCNSTCVQFVTNENDIWKDTHNLHWKKPIVARIVQTILLIVGFFFLCYGIVWCCIIERKVSEANHPCSYPYFDRFEANAYEPMGIIDFFVDLERDDPDFLSHKSEWDALYKEKYDDKSIERATKRLCTKWGIDTNTLTFNESPYGDQLTALQRMEIIHSIEREVPPVVSIPYDYAKYYAVANQMAVSKFRTRIILFFILPALLFIVISIIWIIKTIPKPDKKAILPRDYADKIEDYSWNGFAVHKYIRFIKDNKYGILDAANRSITVPATFDLIEWREANKSYDGVLDGSRKTYNMDLK